MEGGGGAAAAHNADPRPGFIIIKGVSDKANASKDDRYREYAAFLAASLTLQLLETGPITTPEGSLRDAPPPPEPWRPVDDEALSGYSILDIKTMLKDCFNLAELRSLCSDVGLDWEDFASRGVLAIPVGRPRPSFEGCSGHRLMAVRQVRGRIRAIGHRPPVGGAPITQLWSKCGSSARYHDFRRCSPPDAPSAGPIPPGSSPVANSGATELISSSASLAGGLGDTVRFPRPLAFSACWYSILDSPRASRRPTERSFRTADTYGSPGIYAL